MESKKEMLTKLFIGGIPREATDDDLRQHFSTYGSITDCVAIKEWVIWQHRWFQLVCTREMKKNSRKTFWKPRFYSALLNREMPDYYNEFRFFWSQIKKFSAKAYT